MEEELLIKAKNGLGSRRTLLRCLVEAYLFVPVSSHQNSDEKQGNITLSVPRLSDGVNQFIPAFTSEETLLSWARKEYQCMGFAAPDLALALPADCSLLINPSLRSSLELARTEVEQLAASKWPSNVRAESRPLQGDSLLVVLRRLLGKYGEIEAGYYAEYETEYHLAALGILAKELSSASRFVLLSEIADISKKYLGYAGALCVSDDLHLPSSKVWKIFEHAAPFYVRKALPETTLSAALEVIREDKPLTLYQTAPFSSQPWESSKQH